MHHVQMVYVVSALVMLVLGLMMLVLAVQIFSAMRRTRLREEKEQRAQEIPNPDAAEILRDAPRADRPKNSLDDE